jgi:hypothetical protein
VTAHGTIHHVGATSASLHHSHADRMAGFNVYSIDERGAVESIEAHVLDADSRSFRKAPVPAA